MGARFKLDYSDIKRLEEKIAGLKENAEKSINQYLAIKGSERLISGITAYTPISNRAKKHAKDGKPYTSKPRNLSVIIETKSNYSYLYFPNTGNGTNKKNPKNQGFMQNGVESEYENVVNGLLEAVERRLM